jgi:hypothetical protein
VFLFRFFAAWFAVNCSSYVRVAEVGVPEELSEHEYARRLRERRQELARLGAQHRRLWVYFIVLLSAVIVGGAFALWWRLQLAWTLPLLAALVVNLQWLMKTARVHSRMERIVNFYDCGIARLSHHWHGRGDPGDEFLAAHHLYARDLDLFGEGSLFEYLSTARTGVGRETLAGWLLTPADPGEVASRQLAVAELHGKLELQEKWAAAGGSHLRNVKSHTLQEWANSPGIVAPRYLKRLAVVLPAALLVGCIFALFGFFGAHWLLAMAVPLALEAAVSLRLLKKTRQITADVGLPSFELETIAPLLELLQAQRFECPLLTGLHRRLSDPRGGAASQIRRLRFWTRLLELRHSEYFAAALSLLLWGTNFASVVEHWRLQHREALSNWLESLGYFEALLCLARYSYENPEYTFPVLKFESTALFHAESLGHPLLEKKSCVPCDVILDAGACQVMMVTGSNMSGKSTLLRAVGINAVLAFTGAPVRAMRLELSSLGIGCSISVNDSLQQGRSRFAAEVERLKSIISRAHRRNMLCLLDEILGGTNSKDRLLGTEAILNEIVRSGAIGLITTHDLALADLVAHGANHAKNVHFQEYYDDGEMRFDYKMRPGVSTQTNGMNVMAALGLSNLLR